MKLTRGIWTAAFLASTVAMACGKGDGSSGGGDGDGDGDGDGTGGDTMSGDGDGDGDGEVSCSTSQELCEGACTNLDSDRSNCGACGESCDAGDVCEEGACVANCSTDRTECGGGCVDTDTDPDHCGDCDNSCGYAGADGACVAGECAFVRCLDGFADCDGSEVNGCERDTDNDRRNCGGCGIRCELNETCSEGACSGAPALTDNFSVVELTNACKIIDHTATTGDDNYGIAATATTLFIHGDDDTGSFSAVDLSDRTSLSSYLDGMIGDIKAGVVYQMLDASDAAVSSGGTVVTQIIALNNDGEQTGDPIALSAPVTSGTMVFAGPGFGVLYDDASTTSHRIDFADGTVTELSTTVDVPHCDNNEGFADYGVAEIVDGAISLLYPSCEGVDRVFMADGTTETVFTGTDDLHAFTFVPSLNRWYFHHEGGSSLGNANDDENGGYCEASWSDSSCGYSFNVECDSACVDIATDTAHCGACDNACGDGSECIDGVCDTCAENLKTDCDGTCSDTQRDEQNCGECGVVCGETEPYCVAGACSDAPPSCVGTGTSSGVFTIVPDGEEPLEVYCENTDLEGSGGGWTLLGVFTNNDGTPSWDPFGTAWTNPTTFGTPTDPTINADAKSAAFNVLPVSEIAIVKAGGEVQVITDSCLGNVPFLSVFAADSESDADCASSCDTVFVGGDWTGQSSQDDVLKFRCSDSQEDDFHEGYVLSSDDNSFITTLDNDNNADSNFGLGAGESGDYADWDNLTNDSADTGDNTQILVYGR